MNATYRQQQIKKAQSELESARRQYNEAKTGKGKKQADENMSFWNSKLAFFENIKYGAFEDDEKE